MLAWMRIALPLSVLDASEVYGNAGDAAPPSIGFKCTTDATLRRFLSHFTLTAFERAPTEKEMGEFPASDRSPDPPPSAGPSSQGPPVIY